MRKLLLIAAMLFTASYAVDSAQAFDVKNKVIVSSLGGFRIPVGEFAADDSTDSNAGAANTGYGLGMAVEYGVTNEMLIGGRFAYNRFGVEQSAFGGAISVDDEFDAHWSIIEYLALYGKYLMLPASQTRPYLSGGAFLGTAKFDANTATGDWSVTSDPSMGLNAAVGVIHKIAQHVGIGVECRFAYLFVNEDDSIVPLDNQNLSADAASPLGVRDPGGNSKYLILDGFISYHF